VKAVTRDGGAVGNVLDAAPAATSAADGVHGVSAFVKGGEEEEVVVAIEEEASAVRLLLVVMVVVESLSVSGEALLVVVEEEVVVLEDELPASSGSISLLDLPHKAQTAWTDFFANAAFSEDE